MARYLTTLQVASVYPVSADYLRKKRTQKELKRGDGPKFIRRGRSIIYRDVDIEAWLDAGLQAPPPRRGRPKKGTPLA